jgi:hypothetical protein
VGYHQELGGIAKIRYYLYLVVYLYSPPLFWTLLSSYKNLWWLTDDSGWRRDKGVRLAPDTGC